MADLTQVGEKVLVAPDAVQVLLLQDVLLPVQGLLTLGAVVMFGHRGLSGEIRHPKTSTIEIRGDSVDASHPDLLQAHLRITCSSKS